MKNYLKIAVSQSASPVSLDWFAKLTASHRKVCSLQTAAVVALALASLTIPVRHVSAADVPDEEDLKTMTENSLTSFGRGIKKKDFSKFYEEIAVIWQKQTTPKKLQESFKDFLGKDIDLPSVVKEMDPVFNHPAAIGENDVLEIKGYYPTTPHRVIFDLKYLEEDGEWKLVGIKVDLAE